MAEKPDNTATRFKGKTTKVCESCGVENGNASKRCKKCLTEFVSKAVEKQENILKMGQTSSSQQRKLMERRADILHHHHDQHIVIMAFSKHGKGHTIYLHGTEGPAANFVNGSEPGKIAERLFDKYMRKELREREKAAETKAIPQRDVTGTTTPQTTISAATHQLTTSITQPVTSPAYTTTDVQPYERTPTETTTVHAQSTTSPTLTATVLTPSRATVATSVPNQPTVSTAAITTVITTTTAATMATAITIAAARSSGVEPVAKRSKRSNELDNAGTLHRMVKKGSKLLVLDKDKKPQAVSTLFAMKSMHNKVIPEGHVGIVIDEIFPDCRLKPACPTPFDGEVIEKGAYYIWPLRSLAFHSD